MAKQTKSDDSPTIFDLLTAAGVFKNKPELHNYKMIGPMGFEDTCEVYVFLQYTRRGVWDEEYVIDFSPNETGAPKVRRVVKAVRREKRPLRGK